MTDDESVCAYYAQDDGYYIEPPRYCSARQRYLVAVLASLGFTIMYAMRTAPSVAVLNIAKERDYSGHIKGQFLGAFYYGCVRA